jgi:cGMP-dependent protein kinase
MDEEVRCLALSRDDLTRILGDKIQVIMYNNLQKWAIEKNAILGKLTKIQVEKVVTGNKNV